MWLEGLAAGEKKPDCLCDWHAGLPTGSQMEFVIKQILPDDYKSLCILHITKDHCLTSTIVFGGSSSVFIPSAAIALSSPVRAEDSRSCRRRRLRAGVW